MREMPSTPDPESSTAMPRYRSVLLIISFISFALVGAALYLQHAHDMLPCPLCVIQRYAFIGIGVA
jgi:disulfide bond formation protein DsbB